MWREERAGETTSTLAWLTATLGRAKKIPRLERLVKRRRRTWTVEKQRAAMMALSQTLRARNEARV